MSQIAMGDLAQSMLLSRRNVTLKDSIQALSDEVVTGLVRDRTARIKGDYVPLAGIEATLTQLEAYRSVTNETAMLANHMQIALTSISENASVLSSSLLAAASSNSPSRINTLGYDAGQRLQSAMSALNTRMGERSLFAGQAVKTAALADAETLLVALDTVIAGAISSADVETALDGWFSDPAGFAATIYQGGAALGPVPIGPDQQAQVDVTALDPAIVSMIKGLAMASLLSRGALAGSDVARADLAKRAGESLASSQTAFAELGARLGTVEASVINAGVQNDTHKSALETARLGLLSVDPYETATKLQQAQTQLETLFTLTSRMSRLSLVNFL
jgi:flagellar hook-associated protein 3 FlgL